MNKVERSERIYLLEMSAGHVEGAFDALRGIKSNKRIAAIDAALRRIAVRLDREARRLRTSEERAE